MTARELLERNGDFSRSPLLETARALHRLLTAASVPYAIIGGLAVVRNGAVRTTHDVDILVRREDWQRVIPRLRERFEIHGDHASDRTNGVPVDVLFAGDDWDMVLPLPDPKAVAQLDRELGASFLGLADTLQLKTAVYLAKKGNEGIELAAKDLADVVALLQANPGRLSASTLAGFHPVVGRELKRILRKLRRR